MADKLSSSQYLSIVKKIQEVVCNKQESGSFGVICPVKGQQCIAQYEDEDWYRAEVVGIPNLQEVEVKFVDFGNIAKVNMRKIRRIEEELLRFPCQVNDLVLLNSQAIMVIACLIIVVETQDESQPRGKSIK
ncbi:Hypothetical predicted protein [Pelobates cultripes]|uniref:Tudor domain-containing protein n=1 Tax=Pelobates cultripes TaxID=61616 RepID=A0AAD1VP64_PELCU|nr:Hypothetical predicted protein [Pelobates cultripes]